MWNIVYYLGGILSFPFFKWALHLIAFFIGAGFYLFSPERSRRSRAFYKVLFPGKSTIKYFYYSIKQFLNFTIVFIDRFIRKNYKNVKWYSDGWEYLKEAMNEKKGGIILMSHVGNWDAAAHLMRNEGGQLMIYMGAREKEHLEKKFKNKLSEKGIIIQVVKEEEKSPFKIIEGIEFLKNGGFVAITGDRSWRESQRSANVKFLGKWVSLPETPHLMSLMSKKPLYIFSSSKIKRNLFYFTSTKPYYVIASKKSERTLAIKESMENYSKELEKILKKNPFEWYHFEPFFIDD